MYEAPQVVELGTIEEMTLAEVVGRVTDQDFPTNTPIEDLTFSI